MKKRVLTSVLCIVVAFAATAQQAAKKELTAADYDRATKFLSFNTSKLVYNTGVNPVWLGDGRFWYSVSTAAGK